MKFNNDMAKQSPSNAWFNWRGQFKSDAEALVCLLRVINSRIKNQRITKNGWFTRKYTNYKIIKKCYKIKEFALLFLENKELLTACYPEQMIPMYTCNFCNSGCILCDGKKYVYNKVLYKKIFNIEGKVYSFHSVLKPIDETKLFNNKQTVITCEFKDVDQRNFDVKLACRSLEAAIRIVKEENFRTVFSLDSLLSVKKLFTDNKESIELLFSTK
jgi:hypothetical protein